MLAKIGGGGGGAQILEGSDRAGAPLLNENGHRQRNAQLYSYGEENPRMSDAESTWSILLADERGTAQPVHGEDPTMVDHRDTSDRSELTGPTTTAAHGMGKQLLATWLHHHLRITP